MTDEFKKRLSSVKSDTILKNLTFKKKSEDMKSSNYFSPLNTSELKSKTEND